jgi:molybdopterin synthase sulfur carrier subunit
MIATIALPGVLRAHAGGHGEVDVEVEDGTSTVRTVLDALSHEHPALVRRIRDEQGELRRFVNVYVGDTDVRDVQGLETPVPDGARLLVLPSVAGG